MIAIALSILFPGLGQFYYGRVLRGSVMLLLAVTPLYPAALVWSVVDAYRLSQQGLTPQFTGKEALVAIVACLVVVPLCAAVLMVTSLKTFIWYRDTHQRQSPTQAEGALISAAIIEYRTAQRVFPETLVALTTGRPLRLDWLTDAWGRPYSYEVRSDRAAFRLASSGRDGQWETTDDIVWEQSTPEAF